MPKYTVTYHFPGTAIQTEVEAESLDAAYKTADSAVGREEGFFSFREGDGRVFHGKRAHLLGVEVVALPAPAAPYASKPVVSTMPPMPPTPPGYR